MLLQDLYAPSSINGGLVVPGGHDVHNFQKQSEMWTCQYTSPLCVITNGIPCSVSPHSTQQSISLFYPKRDLKPQFLTHLY